jgi:hypothetical protein
VIYFEWWMKYSTDHVWRVNPEDFENNNPGRLPGALGGPGWVNLGAASDHNKTFEVQNGSQNRWLLTVTGDQAMDLSGQPPTKFCTRIPPAGSSGYCGSPGGFPLVNLVPNNSSCQTCADVAAPSCNLTNRQLCGPSGTARPDWSIYPNSQFPGGTGQEAFFPGGANGANASFRYNPSLNVAYHNVVEVTMRCGTSGRWRMWVNDVLVMDYSGIQTVQECGSIGWGAMRMSGIYAWPLANSTVTYDQMRATTSSLVPGGGLNAPSNPKICRGAGCTPSMVLPVPVLAGLLIWLRRRLRRR